MATALTIGAGGPGWGSVARQIQRSARWAESKAAAPDEKEFGDQKLKRQVEARPTALRTVNPKHHFFDAGGGKADHRQQHQH